MNIGTEVEGLKKYLGSKELLEKVLKAYLEEADQEIRDLEEEYQIGEQTLSFILTDEQKMGLEEMKRLFMENMQYSLGFGINRGIYAGFEQYFVEKPVKDPFDKYAHDDLMMMPSMKKHREYYQRRNKINELFEDIQKKLEKESRETLTVIYNTFDEKSLGVLRYAFYIGYRYAISIIESVNPLAGADIADRILCTEYELSFITTRKEQEWEQIHFQANILENSADK